MWIVYYHCRYTQWCEGPQQSSSTPACPFISSSTSFSYVILTWSSFFFLPSGVQCNAVLVFNHRSFHRPFHLHRLLTMVPMSTCSHLLRSSSEIFSGQEMRRFVYQFPFIFQQDRIADFPKNQTLVDRINALSKDIEEVADEDSKTALHDELLNFNARWQVIVTRLEDYSDNDLPDQNSFGCMGFVKKRLSGSAF